MILFEIDSTLLLTMKKFDKKETNLCHDTKVDVNLQLTVFKAILFFSNIPIIINISKYLYIASIYKVRFDNSAFFQSGNTYSTLL